MAVSDQVVLLGTLAIEVIIVILTSFCRIKAQTWLVLHNKVRVAVELIWLIIRVQKAILHL